MGREGEEGEGVDVGGWGGGGGEEGGCGHWRWDCGLVRERRGGGGSGIGGLEWSRGRRVERLES